MKRTTHPLDIAAAGTLLAALVTALVVPPEVTQGDLARIIFVHVPAAWLAYLAFIVTLVGSVAYLVRRNRRWDRVAASSAEVGVYFTGLALVTGSIWGKPTWGVWWTWDARLVLTAVMFFVYLGYLALRRGITDPSARARRSAWFGVLAVVQIPLVHFSVVWWRTLHQPPTILRPGPMQMDAAFRGGLVMAVVAFTVVYAALLRRRIRLARLEDALEERLGDVDVAGADVAAPDLTEAFDG
ncbi:MAG: cytochrome c biogenesis protein CcsA [Acidimicrobiia bacterium]|nr:cytochrome c biogenesis protein CcsA [Acidimicrobiia bacterium]